MTETLGQTIRRIRIEKGISILTLSKRVQISPSYLTMIELDQGVPTWEKLALISVAIEQDMDSLLIKVFPQDVVDVLKKYPEMHKAFVKEFRKTKNFKNLESLPSKQQEVFNGILEIEQKGIPITKRSIAAHLGVSVYEISYVISRLISRNLIQADKKIFSEEDHYGNQGRGQWLQTYIITKKETNHD